MSSAEETVSETEPQKYSVVQGLELLRFRAWLEVEMVMGDTLVFEQFPIANLTITASLNSIPTATVDIAVGFDMSTREVGTIHSSVGKEMLQPFDYTYAKIYFRNLSLVVDDNTDKGVVIFEGYINSSSESYSRAGTTISLTMVHWAYGLDACPACNTRINPLSASDFTSALYRTSEIASTGGAAPEEATGPSIQNLWGRMAPPDANAPADPNRVEKSTDANAIATDLIEFGLLVVLRTLYQYSEKTHLHTFVPDLPDGMFDMGLRINVAEILANRVKGGDVGTAEADDASMPVGEFPILALNTPTSETTGPSGATTENAVLSNTIQGAIYNNFFSVPSKDLVMNSLWATMVAKAGTFGFMIVPRAHELRFIPKWYMAHITDPIELDPIVIQAASTHPRPIKAVITMSSKVKGDTTGATSDTTRTLNDYGLYWNDNVKSGTLLVRNRPEWATDIPFLPLINAIPDPAVAAPVNTQATASNGPTPQPDSLYKRLAEEAYWDTMLEGSQLVAVGPLRFDVCPGSTVRVIGFQNPITPVANQSYLGLVTTLKFTLDMEQAIATTQYILTHVRPEDNKLNTDEAMSIHPIFNCKPFTGANWTEEYAPTTVPETDLSDMQDWTDLPDMNTGGDDLGEGGWGVA
jgi:hypothetical protein